MVVKVGDASLSGYKPLFGEFPKPVVTPAVVEYEVADTSDEPDSDTVYYVKEGGVYREATAADFTEGDWTEGTTYYVVKE